MEHAQIVREKMAQPNAIVDRSGREQQQQGAQQGGWRDQQSPNQRESPAQHRTQIDSSQNRGGGNSHLINNQALAQSTSDVRGGAGGGAVGTRSGDVRAGDGSALVSIPLRPRIHATTGGSSSARRTAQSFLSNGGRGLRIFLECHIDFH